MTLFPQQCRLGCNSFNFTAFEEVIVKEGKKAEHMTVNNEL